MSRHTVSSVSTNHVLFSAGGAANPGMAKKKSHRAASAPPARAYPILSLLRPSAQTIEGSTNSQDRCGWSFSPSRARYLAAASKRCTRCSVQIKIGGAGRSIIEVIQAREASLLRYVT